MRPKGRRPRFVGLSEAAPGGVGSDEGGAVHIPYQGELPTHLPARPDCSCVPRWNLVPLGHAGRAGTHHSRTSHRRPAGERIRLRGKAFAVGTFAEGAVCDRPQSSEIVGGHRSPPTEAMRLELRIVSSGAGSGLPRRFSYSDKPSIRGCLAGVSET